MQVCPYKCSNGTHHRERTTDEIRRNAYDVCSCGDEKGKQTKRNNDDDVCLSIVLFGKGALFHCLISFHKKQYMLFTAIKQVKEKSPAVLQGIFSSKYSIVSARWLCLPAEVEDETEIAVRPEMTAGRPVVDGNPGLVIHDLRHGSGELGG